MEPIRLSLILLVLASAPVRAVDLPGSGLWPKLLLGEADSNGDGVIDSGEWQNGVDRAFLALDPQGEGVITAAKVDAVQGEIAKSLGDTGAAAAVEVIKRLLGVSGDKTLTREEFGKRAAGIVKRLDANQDTSLDETELKGMVGAFLAWTLKGE